MASKQMRAFRVAEGAREPRLQNVDIPQVHHSEVLIKIVAAGLVPGVLKIVAAGRTGQLPLTVGHQAAGVIEEVGDGVEKFQVGQRVRVHPSLSCGVCKYCTTGRDHMCPEGAVIGFQGFGKGRMPLYEKYHDGGVADYILVPSSLVDPLPDNVSFDVGAKIQDLANAVRVLKAGALPIGSTVAITAATGTMGTACVRLAPMFGIRHLILVGRNIERLQTVQKLSEIPCSVISISHIKEGSPPLPALVRQHAPEGVDAIIDFMPSGTDIYSIMGALAVDGTLVHMGASLETLPLPLMATMVNCWKFVGTRNNSREDALLVLRWLQDGSLKADDLITHHFKLDDIDEAVRVINDRSIPMWMTVIHP